MNTADDFFAKVYDRAPSFDGHGSVIDAIRGRGAIWYQHTTDRAVLMTGVSEWRIWGDHACAEIAEQVKAGHLVKDACPLDETTNIYVATVRA